MRGAARKAILPHFAGCHLPGRAPARLLAAACLLLSVSAACEEGTRIVEVGWVHQRPQESNDPPRTRLRDNPALALGGTPDSFQSPAIKLSTPDLNTLGISFKYFLSDHWAIALGGGYPRRTGLYASGEARPPGLAGEAIYLNLDQQELNPAATARQWSPLLLLEYHFDEMAWGLRPYLALASTYTFFTGVELNEALEEEINQRFGSPLAISAGKSGPTRTQSDIDSAFGVGLTLGFTKQLTKSWHLGATASYLRLQTQTRLHIDAADGTRLLTSETDLKLNPLAFSLVVGRSF